VNVKSQEDQGGPRRRTHEEPGLATTRSIRYLSTADSCLSGNWNRCRTNCAAVKKDMEPGAARVRQEEPGEAGRSQEELGGARRSQEEPGGARRSQEVKRSQEEPGGA
jgi:hypothetical protein